jgi:hypothetical protein
VSRATFSALAPRSLVEKYVCRSLEHKDDEYGGDRLVPGDSAQIRVSACEEHGVCEISVARSTEECLDDPDELVRVGIGVTHSSLISPVQVTELSLSMI